MIQLWVVGFFVEKVFLKDFIYINRWPVLHLCWLWQNRTFSSVSLVEDRGRYSTLHKDFLTWKCCLPLWQKIATFSQLYCTTLSAMACYGNCALFLLYGGVAVPTPARLHSSQPCSAVVALLLPHTRRRCSPAAVLQCLSRVLLHVAICIASY